MAIKGGGHGTGEGRCATGSGRMPRRRTTYSVPPKSLLFNVMTMAPALCVCDGV
jgi:hypothetical protein